jgi:hypothetical protein
VSHSVGKGLEGPLKPLIRKTQPYAEKIAHRGIWVEFCEGAVNYARCRIWLPASQRLKKFPQPDDFDNTFCGHDGLNHLPWRSRVYFVERSL